MKSKITPLVAAIMLLAGVPKMVAADVIITTHNSDLYIMRVEVGDEVFEYIYSSDIIFSAGCLEYLNENYPSIQGVIPEGPREFALSFFDAKGTDGQIDGKGFAWYYGGIDGPHALTLDYWDDIVDIANNNKIIPGTFDEIKTTGGTILFSEGQRNETAIVQFYADNKVTYHNEDTTRNTNYVNIGGVIYPIEQEYINREIVDIYELTVVCVPPAAQEFVPVTDIFYSNSWIEAGEPMTLTGTVLPENATHQEIVWTIKDAGSTGAEITDGNVLNTTSGDYPKGKLMTLTATIADGLGEGEDYVEDFGVRSLADIPTDVLEINSELYNIHIISGSEQFDYVYSPGIYFHSDLLDYLNENYPQMQHLIPAAGESTSTAEYFFAAGTHEFDVNTVDYWDDIVAVANNKDIVPAIFNQIKTTGDAVLYGEEQRNETAIGQFYADNKSAYVKEFKSITTQYTADEELELYALVKYTINRDIVDIYDLTVVCVQQNIAIEQCTVTFETGEGGSAVAPVTVDYDATATQPEAPTRTGYTFAGWHIGSEEFDFATPITEDITLTAQWTAVVTGINTAKRQSLRIYANPLTNGEWIIESGELQAGEPIAIYNLRGVLVATYRITGEQTSINISHLPSGIYVLRAGNANAKVIKN